MSNMRINKVTFKDKILDDYNVIIDVRTPLEFKEDHLPNSTNFPVLTNNQRHKIGIQYKENSFLAKKKGAQIISSNISKIISKINFNKNENVLIYCWRGGLRSLSLYLVLKQIGYNVNVLEGGYKSYRKFVVNFLEKNAPKYKYNQIMGITGVGKTLFLKELSKRYQVIDFEGLAKHKGSILGNIPNQNQPTQKFFETLIYKKLRNFDIKKKLWVEAESIKVGKLNIPSLIWKNMPNGKNIKLVSDLDERVKYILKDYKYFISNPNLLKDALRVLKQIIPKDNFKEIEMYFIKRNYYELVKSLIIHHYDRVYKKTRAESQSPIHAEIELERISLGNIKKIINSYNFH